MTPIYEGNKTIYPPSKDRDGWLISEIRSGCLECMKAKRPLEWHLA